MSDVKTNIIIIMMLISLCAMLFVTLLYRKKYVSQNIRVLHLILSNSFVTTLLSKISTLHDTDALPTILNNIKEFFQFKTISLYQINNGHLTRIIEDVKNSHIKHYLEKNFEVIEKSTINDTYYSSIIDEQATKVYIVPITHKEKKLILCMSETKNQELLRTDWEIITKTIKQIIRIYIEMQSHASSTIVTTNQSST
ncbi:hypothetical protein [Candidatus Sneabacter namystus]|uniref:Uncharacterized protein n=1 Tax=Candidatus Sneabacter namystus TaxID=2601646 RepID=A0A5C0UHG4_9RICK|nr:hypothetical protein [Candidatus Sneabacter namystus]QEK39558.1 hypothetical protein FZC37_01220 [Candidatus Sneabacter namystus]